MKLRVFTKKQWKKKKEAIRKECEGNLERVVPVHDCYHADENAILAAALYQLMIERDPESLLEIDVKTELVQTVGFGITGRWTNEPTRGVHVFLKTLLPEPDPIYKDILD